MSEGEKSRLHGDVGGACLEKRNTTLVVDRIFEKCNLAYLRGRLPLRFALHAILHIHTYTLFFL